MLTLLVTLSLLQSGQVPSVPEYQLVAERRYGSVDGPLVFSSVGSIAVTNDLLYVGQPRSGEVAIVRVSDGALVRMTREGEGPGEFRIPGEAGVIGDTAWIQDASRGRISLFDREGGFLHTIPFYARHRMVGLTTDGAVLAHRNPSSPRDTTPLPLLRILRSGQRQDTLKLMRQKYPTLIDVRAAGRYFRMLNPFAQAPMAALDADRRSAVIVSLDGPPGHEIEIERVLGDLRSTVRVSYAPQPVRHEDIERMIGIPKELRTRALFQSLRFPSTWIPVNRIVVARNGDVWLGAAVSDEPVNWIIVNRTGHSVGKLQSPAGGSIQIVDGNTVWGSEVNEDDVAFIVRYQLSRK